MQLTSATGNDDVLSPLHFIYRRRSKTRSRQISLPKQPPGPFIEGPDLRIAGGGNKKQAAGRYHGTAIILRPGMYPFSLELRVIPQGIPPGDGPAVEIDGRERPPGRGHSRITFFGQEFIIPGSAVGQPVVRVFRRLWRTHEWLFLQGRLFEDK